MEDIPGAARMTHHHVLVFIESIVTTKSNRKDVELGNAHISYMT